MNLDLLIIGGGVAALSTAWEAHKRGLRFHLLHKKRVGSATHAAAGMLCPELEADTALPPLLELAQQSLYAYPQWVKELSIASQLPSGYHAKGTLLVAQHRDHLAELTQIAARQQERGLESTRLTVRALRQKEPMLAPRLAGGLYFPRAHSIYPRMLYAMLHKVILPFCSTFQDLHIAHDDKSISSVRQDNIIWKAHNYVVADGSWSMNYPLLSWLPLRPIKGQYIILEGAQLIENTLRSPDVYMVPRPNGRLYIGASMEEEGFCTKKRAGQQLDLLYHSWQFVRGIYELYIEESSAGFRPTLRDNQPAIGRGQLDNLWLNIGHFRHGITIAPKAAQLLLQLIQKPDTNNPFSPLRFWNEA